MLPMARHARVDEAVANHRFCSCKRDFVVKQLFSPGVPALYMKRQFEDLISLPRVKSHFFLFSVVQCKLH